MTNENEQLLNTVQQLRRYVRENPIATASLEQVRWDWLPGELFPPDEVLVSKALNVLINAGELVMREHDVEKIFLAPAAAVAG